VAASWTTHKVHMDQFIASNLDFHTPSV
jgi:hypothetical protein